MAISRMQQPRQQYGLGSIVKSAKKAVKGVTKGVSNVLKSDAGKLGLVTLGGLGLFDKGPLDFLSRFNPISSFSDMGPLAQFGTIAAAGAGLTAMLGAAEEGDAEAVAATQDVGSLRKYLASYYSNLGYTVDEIAENVERDTSEYTQDMARGMASGGRIGYAMGTEDKVEMAAGIEGLPINVNPKGIKELDLRETGGFIAPVGVKEKADDIPAMLSNNEFVFTADAVRAAGGGSVNKGAQVMYDTMKKLESKVV